MGHSPFSIAQPENVVNPVLTWEDVTDVPAAFVADPFMCEVNGTWHMFFEVMNLAARKGEIGFATSNNGVDWSYEGIVLAEPTHLSYPYLFEWQNEYYMMPESARQGAVRLYKATRFPEHWSCVGDILNGSRFADSSIFRHQDQWWLFTDAGPKSKSPILRLYSAQDLIGPWLEHPSSPLVNGDPHIARPCGRVLIVDGTPIRFAQDVFPLYGSQVRAFEILKLSSEAYEERQVGPNPVLAPGDSTWNSDGMHHIDAHRIEDGTWIACVDGFSVTRD